ncbi:noggin-like [Hippocampus comes]|uniref:noggin-like n=1 Tax=Hippocampus comes TaxID=109280 RepID=UPI00094EAD47|nr:PREDICTED: noggin-like [Hippocampus comes]
MLLLRNSRMSGAWYMTSLEPSIIAGQRVKYNSKREEEENRKHFILLLKTTQTSAMLNWDVYLCCSMYACALLRVSAASISNISTKYQLPNDVQDQQHGDSPFLHLRASLPSYSQPLRPYTFVTTAEDFPYVPKPRHYRSSRLLRILGSSFDPFWMSIDQPSEGSGVCTGKGNCDDVARGDSLPVKVNVAASREDFNLSASAVLSKARENQRQGLAREAADVDLSSLPPDVASSLRTWLVRSATCGLRSQWVDLGPAFWPRWLRQTDCDKSDGVRSCSFPSGMVCVRAQTTHIRILAWHCLKVRDDESEQLKSEISDISMLLGISEEMRKCLWRPVPYPVVTACTCKCK